MSVVDLGMAGGAFDVEPEPAGRWAAVRRHVRELPPPGRIALAGLIVSLMLVIAAAFLPWATEFSKPLQVGTAIGPSVSVGLRAADPLALGAYYLIWLIIFGAGGAAIFDRSHGRAWFGAGTGAVAAQALFILPIQRDLQVLNTSQAPAGSAWIDHSIHEAGAYAMLGALIAVSVALVISVRGRIVPRRRVTGLLLAATYAAVVIAQNTPWVTVTGSSAVEDLKLLGGSAHLGPVGLFGPWQAAYGLIWTAFFAGAGCLVYAGRPRRSLFGGLVGVLATQVLVVAGLLHDPQSLYVGFTGGIPHAPILLDRGAYAIGVAFVLAASTVAAAVGRRAIPEHSERRVGAVILAAGFALALAAQLTTWIHDPSVQILFGTGNLDPVSLSVPPELGFYLALLVTLGSAGALVYATDPWRAVLLGGTAGGVVGLLVFVGSYLHRPEAWVNQPVDPSNAPITWLASGSFLALGAIVVIAIGASIGARSVLSALSGRKPALLAAAVGATLAVAAQETHWYWLHQTYTIIQQYAVGTLSGSALVWSSASPLRYYVPMTAAWVLVSIAVGTALLTGGRLQQWMIRLATIMMAAAAAVTASFLTGPPLMHAYRSFQEIALIHQYPSYSPGSGLVVAAFAAFATSLVLLELARRRSARPPAELDDESGHDETGAGAASDDIIDLSRDVQVLDHRSYLRNSG